MGSEAEALERIIGVHPGELLTQDARELGGLGGRRPESVVDHCKVRDAVPILLA
jgi:hypothetical protein